MPTLASSDLQSFRQRDEAIGQQAVLGIELCSPLILQNHCNVYATACGTSLA